MPGTNSPSVVTPNTNIIRERQRPQTIHCSRKVAMCSNLSRSNAKCFGTDLGYNSIHLTNGQSYEDVQNVLTAHKALRYVPKCWENIQPLLCAYYLPECRQDLNNTNKHQSNLNLIDLIPKKICLKARDNCKIISSSSIIAAPKTAIVNDLTEQQIRNDKKKSQTSWPKFLDCDNKSTFYEDQQFWSLEKEIKVKMKSDNVNDKITCSAIDEQPGRGMQIKKLWSQQFNATQGMCLSPYLLPNSITSYNNIDGCDLNCNLPQYTSEERTFVRRGYYIPIWIALVCNFLASITMLMGGSKQVCCPNNDIKNYPNHIVLVMQICCILNALGNSILYSIFGTEKVACREDGTRIHGKPTKEIDVCGVSLFLNYFFFVALCIWTVILSYVWLSTLVKYVHKIKNGMTASKDRQSGCSLLGLHICTWIVSLILSVIALQVGKTTSGIEGNSLLGICFLNSEEATKLFMCLVLLPIVITVIVVVIFTCRSCSILSWVLRTAKTQVFSKRQLRKIQCNRLSILLFVVPIILVSIFLISLSLYNMQQTGVRDESLKDFIIAKFKQYVASTPHNLKASSALANTPAHRQSPVNLLLLALCQPLCFILVSTLVCTQAINTWKKFFLKLYKSSKSALHYITYGERSNKETALQMSIRRTNQDNEKGKIEEENKRVQGVPKVKKLQLIAQAWAKRYDVQRTGQLSITLSDEEDSMKDGNSSIPSNVAIAVGGLPKLHPSCEEDSDFHSLTEFNEFAAALPRLVQRREGCSGVFALGLKPWGSVDSNLHLSRTVSIRSSRIAGYSFNSRRSSIVGGGGSRIGNGDSQLSTYQSDFSDYLFGLHRKSSRKSKSTTGRAMSFVGRFSKRSIASIDVSSKDMSIVSDDNNVTILPAITINQSPKQKDTAEEPTEKAAANTKLSQLISRLQEKQLKIPAPGKSINVTVATASKANDRDLKGYPVHDPRNLEMKNNSIISSKETYLSEDGNSTEGKEKGHMNKVPLSKDDSNYEQVAVQTSLIDLSTLGQCPMVKDLPVQYDSSTLPIVSSSSSAVTTRLPLHTLANTASTTTSSSQTTETNFFLPKPPRMNLNGNRKDLNEARNMKPEKHSSQRYDEGNGKQQHIDANVVKIHVGRDNNSSSANEIPVNADIKSSCSEASSSIPSSYEKSYNTTSPKKTKQTIIINPESFKQQIKNESAMKAENEKLDEETIPPLLRRRYVPIPTLLPASPNYNRGRRGGIIPKESGYKDIAQAAAATHTKQRLPPILTIPPPPPILNSPNYSAKDSPPTMQMFSPNPYNVLVPSSLCMLSGHTLEEVELKVRAPRGDGDDGEASGERSINAQLQSMPDSIIRVSISTPSS